MINKTLFTPIEIEEVKDFDTEFNTLNYFTVFLNKLEGWKTKCKNLHWSAPQQSIHVYLDDFHSFLSNYQDALAETSMGILGKLQPNVIKGVESDSLNASTFICEVIRDTITFYEGIPDDVRYVGITSDCESFLSSLSKYKYLFSLCEIRTYP